MKTLTFLILNTLFIIQANALMLGKNIVREKVIPKICGQSINDVPCAVSVTSTLLPTVLIESSDKKYGSDELLSGAIEEADLGENGPNLKAAAEHLDSTSEEVKAAILIQLIDTETENPITWKSIADNL